MISLEHARAYVVGHLPERTVASVPFDRSAGMVVAAPVVATVAVPPFDNTAMDGFAVRAADTGGAFRAKPVRLIVVATVAAGDDPTVSVGAGQAARIMTGAVMPRGADAVVMVERTTSVDNGAAVDIEAEVEAGRFVRMVGEAVRPGQQVLSAGAVITPAHVGVLSEVGVAEVEVFRPATVGVLSTGDELVDDGRPLAPGQIRDSNRPMLLALAAQAGCEVVDLGCAADDESAISDAIGRGAATCDVVLSTGGVSMGDFDYVKVVLERLGDMRWMQIAIKPAKPFAYGVVDGSPVFGLPGNPVSSLVSFELLVRPALRHLAGHAQTDRPLVDAVLPDGAPRRPDGKVHYVRVWVGWDGARFVARPIQGQGSHQLLASASANGLAVLDDGDGVAPGGVAPVMVLDAASAVGSARGST